MPRFENALMAHPEGSIRRTLVERVEGAGAAVQATADGVQALEIVRVAPPQLAFVGPQVESMAALDLCRALANKGIAVVFLGAEGASRDDAIKAGAVEYLELPSFVNEAGVVGKLLTAREKDPGSGDWFVSAKLSDFGCPALVRALVAVGRSAILTLERGDRSGEVRFYEGEVTSSQLGTLTGMQALHRLLLWQEAMVEVRFAPVVRRQQITLTRVEVLTEMDRFLRDCAHAAKQIGSTKAVYEQELAQIARVLERIPSEVGGLVRLFDGQRTVADVIQDSPFRPFDTIRVTGRLVEMGALKRILRGGSQAPKAKTKKKPSTPVPRTAAVHKWLTTPPRGTATPRLSSDPIVQAVLEAKPATPTPPPPPSLEQDPPLSVTLEPPVVLTTPKVPEGKRIAQAELSLEKRIEEALARHAPPPPAPDRQGLAAIVAQPINPFGAAPPAVELPRTPTPIPIPVPPAPPPPPPVQAAPPPPPPVQAAPPPPPPPVQAALPPPPPPAPAPAHAPTPRPRAAEPVFNALEEEFFSKVDEHGHMPLPYDPVDSFDDLE